MEELLFVFKKVLARLFFPVSVALLLGIAGLFLRRRRGMSLFLLGAATLWLLVFSFPITGLMLIRSLESRAGGYADPKTLSGLGVRHIVVLSSGFREGHLSHADRLGCSVLRLLEGVRLWRATSGSKLILTGGTIPGLNTEVSIAKAMAEMALDLGVPTRAMVLESESWTTEDQARLVAPIVGKGPFALVTSGYHMPRAVLIFEREGLRPVAAPCDFFARKILWHYDTLIPNADGLWMSQVATQEHMVRWWVLLKQRLGW
ncbi:MAG: YdcF family protein [Desulfomonile tiedjei]|nr:YdcF family protein [Desulfomonile tiedjei]